MTGRGVAWAHRVRCHTCHMPPSSIERNTGRDATDPPLTGFSSFRNSQDDESGSESSYSDSDSEDSGSESGDGDGGETEEEAKAGGASSPTNSGDGADGKNSKPAPAPQRPLTKKERCVGIGGVGVCRALLITTN